MIKLDISAALFLYLLFTVVGILALWAFFGLGSRFKSYSDEEKNIWQCSVCLHTYIDSKHETISACPRCNSYNTREAGQSGSEKTVGR